MDLRFLYYCFQFLVLDLSRTCNFATGNETEVDVQLQGLAPSHDDELSSSSFDSDDPTVSLQDLRRQYKLDYYLWAGSGDGPSSSDHDGGLAWVDNGADRGQDQLPSLILVTKTMVLYRTVLTTVYSVELTPTLVISSPSMTQTPSLPITWSPTPSLTDDVVTTPNFSSPVVVEPSQTFVVPIGPTAMPTTPEPLSNKTETIPTPSPGTDTSVPTNPIYRVNTVIKANRSDVDVPQVRSQFQESMQRNLATVYASAFKRHLLNSLGVLINSANQTEGIRRRRRRQVRAEQGELDYSSFYVSDLNNNVSVAKLAALAAATTMNVSVSIVKITPDDTEPHVSMDYVIMAEGKPVPGASAAQDMKLVSKEEMEEQIGYKVIKKAEGLDV